LASLYAWLILRGRAVDAFTGAMLRAAYRSNAVALPALLVVLVATLGVMAALSRPYYMTRDALARGDVPNELDAQLKRARPMVLAWSARSGSRCWSS